MADQTHISGRFAVPSWKDFLGWWLGGMKRCLPQRLRDSLGQARQFILLMQGDGFVLQSHGADAVQNLAEFHTLRDLSLDQWLGAGWQRKAPLSLRVPRESVFTRTVELPLAAAGNLGRVLQFEMDRLTPFADKEILFDYRVLARQPDKGQVLVELAVLRKELIEAPLADLEAGGQPPHVVDAPALWPGANLLRSGMARRRGSASIGTLLAAGLVMALVAAVVLTPLLHERQVVVELDARLQRAREQATVVARLQRQLDDAAAVANFVLLRQQARVPTVELLRELTERLPDDTWLQQLSIRGSNIEIQGESTKATLLIELLENSPRFESVSFRAPLTQARGSDAERFSITMNLTGKADH
ncbi:MAG: PilN domain-containing protein [Chromatiaceae bacterium]|nr:PilN domain-containing protein [Chromatiaceae bacterium]